MDREDIEARGDWGIKIEKDGWVREPEVGMGMGMEQEVGMEQEMDWT